MDCIWHSMAWAKRKSISRRSQCSTACELRKNRNISYVGRTMTSSLCRYFSVRLRLSFVAFVSIFGPAVRFTSKPFTHRLVRSSDQLKQGHDNHIDVNWMDFVANKTFKNNNENWRNNEWSDRWNGWLLHKSQCGSVRRAKKRRTSMHFVECRNYMYLISIINFYCCPEYKAMNGWMNGWMEWSGSCALFNVYAPDIDTEHAEPNRNRATLNQRQK